MNSSAKKPLVKQRTVYASEKGMASSGLANKRVSFERELADSDEENFPGKHNTGSKESGNDDLLDMFRNELANTSEDDGDDDVYMKERKQSRELKKGERQRMMTEGDHEPPKPSPRSSKQHSLDDGDDLSPRAKPRPLPRATSNTSSGRNSSYKSGSRERSISVRQDSMVHSDSDEDVRVSNRIRSKSLEKSKQKPISPIPRTKESLQHPVYESQNLRRKHIISDDDSDDDVIDRKKELSKSEMKKKATPPVPKERKHLQAQEEDRKQKNHFSNRVSKGLSNGISDDEDDEDSHHHSSRATEKLKNRRNEEERFAVSRKTNLKDEKENEKSQLEKPVPSPRGHKTSGPLHNKRDARYEEESDDDGEDVIARRRQNQRVSNGTTDFKRTGKSTIEDSDEEIPTRRKKEDDHSLDSFKSKLGFKERSDNKDKFSEDKDDKLIKDDKSGRLTAGSFTKKSKLSYLESTEEEEDDDIVPREGKKEASRTEEKMKLKSKLSYLGSTEDEDEKDGAVDNREREQGKKGRLKSPLPRERRRQDEVLDRGEGMERGCKSPHANRRTKFAHSDDESEEEYTSRRRGVGSKGDTAENSMRRKPKPSPRTKGILATQGRSDSTKKSGRGITPERQEPNKEARRVTPGSQGSTREASYARSRTPEWESEDEATFGTHHKGYLQSRGVSTPSKRGPMRADRGISEMTKSPHLQQAVKPRMREECVDDFSPRYKTMGRSSSLSSLRGEAETERYERRGSLDTVSIRQTVYDNWLSRKNQTIKKELTKKQLEKQKQEEKAREEKERKQSAKLAFQSWNQQKEETLKEKQERLKAKKKEEEEKELEKRSKTKDAKKYFESWKSKKDEELKEAHRAKMQELKKQKQKEEEEKQDKTLSSKKSFENWKAKKDEYLKKELKEKKKREKTEKEKQEEEKYEKTIKSADEFQKWVESKGKPRHAPPPPTLTQRAWVPGSRHTADCIPGQVQPVIQAPTPTRARTLSGFYRFANTKNYGY
ncbi:microtubule-associated protein 9 [Nematostella vectensis]|uniref:microtubule-associated protein 9 n=1 Tax=Nematostella vectensis TaxID=45351 RepID=UPI0020779497|nr:microtubule-associated protein 9 [Nematostella vectensis]